MKIYRVIDDGTCVLTTVDELTALRKLRLILEKRNDTFEWIDEEQLS